MVGHADGSRVRRTSKSSLSVTVLAGGPSAEREVSLVSGSAIADALGFRGHRVRLSDIGPEDLSALDAPADVVFPALHGTWGEDGQLQRVLESRGVPFVGSGSRASATAMDKVLTKQVAIELGIRTAEHQVVTSAAACTLAPPVVVKPIDQGSSVLTAIVRDARELPAAIDQVVAAYGRALVERFIAGDELTVAVLGDRTLPPICIRPKRGFYDYAAKYEDDATEYLFDAGHSASLLESIGADSLRLFRAIGCRHLGRVDWIVERGGSAFLLELNTLPGFTSHSLVPKAAAKIGIAFDELCDRLVRMPLEDGA